MAPMVQETIAVFSFLLAALIIFGILASKGVLQNMEFGKGGVKVAGAEIRQRKSGNLDKLLADQITEIDTDVKEYATKTANALHDRLIKYFAPHIPDIGTRRLIAGTVRQALHNIHLKDNFKFVLRPENTMKFIADILKEVKAEHDEICREIDGFPPFADVVLSIVRERITHDFAYPMRNYQILSHDKKVSLYNQYLPTFEELGDKVKVGTTKDCIAKNENYKKALQEIAKDEEI